MKNPLNILRQSIPNPLESSLKMNEDAFFIEEKHSVVKLVLCDGAGGTGVFSREWADLLSKSIPENLEYFIDHYEDWYKSVCELFYQFVEREKDLSDPVLEMKFFKQGSLSTLLAVWIDFEKRKLFCAGVGDTFLFVFKFLNNTWQLNSIFPINELRTIDDFPKLVSWGVESVDLPSFDDLDIESSFFCVLASDSLAKWILINIDLLDPLALRQAGVNASVRESLISEKYRIRKELIAIDKEHINIGSFLEFLKKAASSEASFSANIISLLEKGVIDQDDFTLIICDSNVSQ